MNDITVKIDITIRQAMKKMSISGEKCLVIADEKNCLMGTLSDGDLRKAILNGSEMSSSVQNIYESNPTFLVEGEYDVDEARNLFIQKRFDLIPVVNVQKKLINVLFWKSILGEETNRQTKKKNLNIPVVIMAGGKGTRLEPFTKVLPKPLVPIHDKPIIEHIIERFTDIGCSDFYLTVNYKGRILIAYFEELQPEYDVAFVEEKDPLGTAGSLRFLLNKFTNPFFVTNCDVIIKVDYASLYEFHQKGEYDITLVASAKEYIIPYGTCELNGDGHLSHINEKPSYDFLINSGLYVVNPDMLKLIPENKVYHVTHMIEDAIKLNKKVGVYPIDDDAWIDIGQWTEYKNAIDKLT